MKAVWQDSRARRRRSVESSRRSYMWIDVTLVGLIFESASKARFCRVAGTSAKTGENCPAIVESVLDDGMRLGSGCQIARG